MLLLQVLLLLVDGEGCSSREEGVVVGVLFYVLFVVSPLLCQNGGWLRDDPNFNLEKI